MLFSSLFINFILLSNYREITGSLEKFIVLYLILLDCKTEYTKNDFPHPFSPNIIIKLNIELLSNITFNLFSIAILK